MQVVIFQQYTRRDCVLTDEIFIRKNVLSAYILFTSRFFYQQAVSTEIHKCCAICVKLCHSEILFKSNCEERTTTFLIYGSIFIIISKT